MRKFLTAASIVVLATVIGPLPADAGSDTQSAPIRTHLLGASEVPGPGDPDGTGHASIRVNPTGGRVCFHLQVRDIGPATAAHIHEGAPDVAGPVVVTLGTPTEGLASGCVLDLDPELVRDIGMHPADYYVNVHNEEYPSGAVRGQLG